MTKRTVIPVPAAPAPIGPFSHAIVAAGLVFVSGQIGRDAEGTMPDGIAAQTEQTIRNLETILAAAGASLADVVKVSVFLRDLGDFAAMNEVYRRFFATEPPVRTTVGVSLIPGAIVEMDAIASAGVRRQPSAPTPDA